MEVKQKLAAELAIEGIPNRSRIAPFNRLTLTNHLGNVARMRKLVCVREGFNSERNRDSWVVTVYKY